MPTQRVHTGTRLVILLAGMLAGWPHLAQAEHRESPRYASATRLPFEKTLPGPINGYEVMKARSLGREYILDVLPLSEKGFTLECRVGRSCGADMAWLMIRDVTTQRGLAVSLAYSGNWRIVVRPDGSNTLVRVVTLPEHLEPFDTINGLPIPGALYAEFTGHWDNGAQPITRFVRAKLLRSLNDDWPWVMYNSWLDEEGTKPTAKALINTASVVADLGCELFVIDAGWFGQVANWPKALGDWHVHRERFPDGIEPVAEEVRRLGMKFGMWIEIECAYPDSPVGKAHPEWFIKDRGRRASNSACLDFGNPEALAWATAQVDRIVTAYKLDYMKMDFNTHVIIDSESYVNGPDPLWKHYRGLANLKKHIRMNYPDLVVEECSSGALRRDVSAAVYADTGWLCDGLENNKNLAINFGATYVFPPETCNHFTAYPEASDYMDLQSCFTISMLGQMGFTGHVSKWDEHTRRYAKEQVALYKKIRPILRSSDVYHLTDQVDWESPKTVEAVQYTDNQSDCSIVFVFHAGAPTMTCTLKLRDLKPYVKYQVSILSGVGASGLMKGAELMTEGLKLSFPNRGASVVVQIRPD